jgi:hypothetical protein
MARCPCCQVRTVYDDICVNYKRKETNVCSGDEELKSLENN